MSDKYYYIEVYKLYWGILKLLLTIELKNCKQYIFDIFEKYSISLINCQAKREVIDTGSREHYHPNTLIVQQNQ